MTQIASPARVPRWGMVVDLNRCVGCQTCTIACKHANDTLPGVQWRSVLDVERGEFPDVERFFLVVGCQHCSDPPCVPVCPTGATSQRADGLVLQTYDLCIGCSYCAVSCPYQARTIVHDWPSYFPQGATPQEVKVEHPERRGVVQKCTFCKDKVDAGLVAGLVPGKDWEATPACANACISQAIKFGDFADPTSQVSRLARDNRHFLMHEELGTRPNIRYLYETPAVPGREADASDLSDEALSDPNSPLVGKVQTFWDYRGAMNFMLGGVGSGLALLVIAAYFGGVVEERALLGLLVVAGAIMGVGLLFVFAKIGRKERFLNALLRPQTSWMSREIYVVGAFYLVLLIDLLRPSLALHGLVALLALAFLVCQARILFAAKGIPAWRVSTTPWMLTVTGLYEGTGALLIALAFLSPDGAASVYFTPVGAMLALVSAAFWQDYRRTAKARGISPLARREIENISGTLEVLGHFGPLALMLIATALGGKTAAIAGAVGGLAAIAGGLFWKFEVICRAAHHQGYAVPIMPQRGSGNRAAPTLPAVLRAAAE